MATGSSTYNYTFTYDRYGNVTCTPNNGQCAVLNFPANNGSTTNQTTSPGYSYDAAGDLAQDPSVYPTNTYSWDGEGRLSKVTQNRSTYVTFTYNAFGQAVEGVYPRVQHKGGGDL